MIEVFHPAYIDPGSGLQFFSFIAPLVAGLLAALGILLWPFRKLWKLFTSKKTRGWSFLVLALILGAVGIVVLKWGGKQPMVQGKRDARVIVIGIDGMDPALTRALMAEGRLPHFKRLAEAGSFAPIQTTNPAQSPVAWSTISTGASPGEHGLFDFIWRHEENYLPDLSLARLAPPEKTLNLFGHTIPLSKPRYVSHRGGTPVWQLTSRAGIATVVIKWPVTFPPDPVAGKMMSGMGVPDLRGGQGTFTFYTSEKVDETRPQGGLVIPVTDSERIATQLIGPRGPNGKDVTIPLEITRDSGSRSVELKASGKTFRLNEGEWSPWIRVKFPIDVLTQVKAMCRFYLRSAREPFGLYCSPMNFDPEHPVFPISYPRDYARRLKEAIGDFHTLGMPHDTWALNEGRMDEDMFLSQTKAIVAEERAMMLHELNRFQSGLLMVVFESVDRLQHMFWRYVDDKSPLYDAEGAKKYGGVIAGHYEEMDEILGEVLQRVDEKTLLLVTSDHGATHFRRAVHLNTWLRAQGWLSLKEGAAEGRPLFRDVDWSRSRAYAVGLGSLYLNLRGRESQGIVIAGEDKARLESDIITRLEGLVDTDTGERVVHKVYRRDEIFTGSLIEKMPDLVVAFRPGYRASWQTALGAAPQAVIEDNLKKWSGDHIVDPSFVPGVFFSNRKLPSDRQISLYDIAPTVLEAFGIASPKSYLGKPVFSRAEEAIPAGKTS
jgi:predicted AlkP superfamily phosphohydrolase/phosphomutase